MLLQVVAPNLEHTVCAMSQSISHSLQHTVSHSCQLVAPNQLDGLQSKLELF